MMRLAWVSLVLTILVGADGIYMMARHYKPSDVNNYNLSDGGTVVIAAVLLMMITIVAFVLGRRASQREQDPIR